MVIEASSPDEPEPASAEPELRGSVLDVLRTLLGDHHERDAVLSIVGQLVARNTDLERRAARLAARFKPSEQVSTAQLVLLLDALKRRPEPLAPEGEATDDYATAISFGSANPELFIERAAAFRAMSKPEEALRSLDTGIKSLGPFMTL